MLVANTPSAVKTLRYLLLALLALLTATSIHRTVKHDLDFKVFHAAGQRLLQGDLDLYNFERDEIFTYKYSPAFPVLMLPFALFSETTARALWAVLNALAFLIAWYALNALLPPEQTGSTLAAKILTLLLVAQPVTNNAIQGNINAVLLALMALALYWDREQAPTLSALSLAVAISIKLTPAALLPFFLFRKSYAVVIRTVLFSSLFLGLLPLVLYGGAGAVAQYQGWVHVLDDTSHFPFFKYTNQSPYMIAFHFFGSPLYAQVFHWISIALFGIAFFYFWRQRLASFVLSTCFFMMLVVPPVAWIDYYLYLCLPLLLVNRWLLEGKLAKVSRWVWGIRFVATGLLVQAFVGREWSDFFAFYGLQFWGLCLLLAIFLVEALSPTSPCSLEAREKTPYCAR